MNNTTKSSPATRNCFDAKGAKAQAIQSLRKALRDVSKVRSDLVCAGYQPGDEVYQCLSKLVVAIGADLTNKLSIRDLAD